MPGSNTPGGAYFGLYGFLSRAATIAVLGVSASSAVGTVTTSGSAVALPSGVSAQTSLGTTRATGAQPPVSGHIGPARIPRPQPISIAAVAAPLGVSARTSVGTVTATGAAHVQPMGITAASSVGSVFAFSLTANEIDRAWDDLQRAADDEELVVLALLELGVLD